MDAERIAKLPKWARQYIRKLECEAEWLEEQLRQISSGDSPIAWELSTGLHTEWHGVPEQATVRFKVANGYIDCALRKDGLQIRNDDARGRPTVKPVAYNVLVIDIEKA